MRFNISAKGYIVNIYVNIFFIKTLFVCLFQNKNNYWFRIKSNIIKVILINDLVRNIEAFICYLKYSCFIHWCCNLCPIYYQWNAYLDTIGLVAINYRYITITLQRRIQIQIIWNCSIPLQYAKDQWHWIRSEPSACSKDILTTQAYKVNELFATCCTN